MAGGWISKPWIDVLLGGVLARLRWAGVFHADDLKLVVGMGSILELGLR